MAVLQSIRNLFLPLTDSEPEVIVPAPPTVYSIKPLTSTHLKEVLRLNIRCFKNGENYTKHTFSYLLNEPNTLSYRVLTASGEIAGFVFVMVNQETSVHLTTIGVAPEHRRRGLGKMLLEYMETSLKDRGVSAVMLEVRVGNIAAQNMYRSFGYAVVQKMENYYNNGEDGYLMMKSLS